MIGDNPGIVLTFVVIFFGLVSGINESGRNRKIPYEPDKRIPIDIPDEKDSLPDGWKSLDSGKYLRSLQRETKMRKIGNKQSSRGPDSMPGKILHQKYFRKLISIRNKIKNHY